MNEKGLALDAWLNALPLDDPYASCPCGCGKKWKFAKKEYAKHEEAFIENWMKGTK